MASVPTSTVAEWLGMDIAPGLSIGEIVALVQSRAEQLWPGRKLSCGLAARWPGYDPLPDVPEHFGVILVRRWRRIVDRDARPDSDVLLAELPEPVRRSRKAGDPWYETVAYVLLPGANLEIRAPEDRGLDTLPRSGS